jgi:hypothetical protein
VSQSNDGTLGGAIVLSAIVVSLAVGLPACELKNETGRVGDALERAEHQLGRIADALEVANMAPDEREKERALQKEIQRDVEDAIKAREAEGPKR